MATLHGDFQRLQVENDGCVLVAAIDFGTTYSGYAFSFKTSPKDIHVNKNWGESLGCMSYKTPTSVLTGPRYQFLAFGYEAEERYTSAIEEEDSDHDCLFRNFKMILHRRENVTLKSTVASTNGTIRPAIDIFSMSLKYLMNHLFNLLKKQTGKMPGNSHVRWVITVPAIWSEEAKQFMRVAAQRAGLVTNKDSKHLMICLEPEVASVYCRTLPIDQFKDTGDSFQLYFQEGMQYVVVDCGGGTVDITAHEILRGGRVKELNAANGGALGGIKVDESFIQLMQKIFGMDFIQMFKNEIPQQWFALIESFEKVKKSFKNDSSSRLVLSLGYAMGTKYQEVIGHSIENAVAVCKEPGISFKSGSLIITHEAAIKLFAPTVNGIVDLVKKQMHTSVLTALSHVLLVGGFGECTYLQEELTKNMRENVTLLVPAEAQMAVIKGAVLYGHKPDSISSRVARRTYGLSAWKKYAPEKHNPGKKVTMHGKDWCTHVFVPFITKGTSVESDLIFKERRRPHRPDQKSMKIRIYSLDKSQMALVEYIDHPDMVLVGKVFVNMPNIEKGLDRAVTVDIKLGGTEIQVSATDVTSGKTTECVVDFLAD